VALVIFVAVFWFALKHERSLLLPFIASTALVVGVSTARVDRLRRSQRFARKLARWSGVFVIRRTYSSLMKDADVDPKVVADLTSHDVDVNLNVCTESSKARQRAGFIANALLLQRYRSAEY
jgi:hypothetical protein